jgi:hypothetical protein
MENEEGKKVRDKNLNKTFNMNLSKETLSEVFRTNESLIHESGMRKKSIRENLQEKKELSKKMDSQIKANTPKNKIRERMR